MLLINITFRNTFVNSFFRLFMCLNFFNFRHMLTYKIKSKLLYTLLNNFKKNVDKSSIDNLLQNKNDKLLSKVANRKGYRTFFF